jgi:ferritin-like metal-binding protein YciE
VAEPVTSAEDLFQARLRQMLFVELELAGEVLPQLLEQARSTDLRYAFERHLVETRGHVATLREILSELQVHAEPERSPALLGLVKEHEQLVKRIESHGHLVSDLAHAQAAAATEHLEMAAYDMLASTAEALGKEEVGIRLRELMEQEQLALEFVERAATKLLAEKVESPRGSR